MTPHHRRIFFLSSACLSPLPSITSMSKKCLGGCLSCLHCSASLISTVGDSLWVHQSGCAQYETTLMAILIFGVDEFFQVPHICKEGETISSTSFSRRAGGKGANTSVAIAKAGQPVDFAGWIGQDGLHLKEKVLPGCASLPFAAFPLARDLRR